MANSKTILIEVAKSICDIQGLIFGGYVGGGTFKQVFSVNTSGGETYALKVIKGTASTQRTDREIQAIERCSHPNIAHMFRVGTHDFGSRKYDFILEEFLAGGTLTSVLNQKGFLDNNQLFTLGRLLIDAIIHIADLDLVHRDIKPDNIMFRVNDDDTPVLVDFGIVRDLSAVSLTQTWLNCGPGTPYFAAPEQLNNQKPLIDWRTDQFSLGVTLCYARFGLHPYQYPNEQNFSLKTIERVAIHGKHGNDMLNNFDKAGLGCLKVMTNAWPVQRFRKPSDLQMAWHQIEGET